MILIVLALIIGAGILVFSVWTNVLWLRDVYIPPIPENAPMLINRCSEATGNKEVGRIIGIEPPVNNKIIVKYVGVGRKGPSYHEVYTDLKQFERVPNPDPVNNLDQFLIHPPHPKFLNISMRNDGDAIRDSVMRRTLGTQEEYLKRGYEASEILMSSHNMGSMSQMEQEKILTAIKANMEQTDTMFKPKPKKL